LALLLRLKLGLDRVLISIWANYTPSISWPNRFASQ